MPASRISDSFLAYCRTGAYMATLPPPVHARAVLPPAPWPSDAAMTASLEHRFSTAPTRSIAAIEERKQPTHHGSTLSGVREI